MPDKITDKLGDPLDRNTQYFELGGKFFERTYEGVRRVDHYGQPVKLAPKPESYKKGGKVKKTGPAKLHKGEFVVKAPAAKKAGPSKLKALNQSQRDIAMLKRKKA